MIEHRTLLHDQHLALYLCFKSIVEDKIFSVLNRDLLNYADIYRSYISKVGEIVDLPTGIENDIELVKLAATMYDVSFQDEMIKFSNSWQKRPPESQSWLLKSGREVYLRDNANRRSSSSQDRVDTRVNATGNMSSDVLSDGQRVKKITNRVGFS